MRPVRIQLSRKAGFRLQEASLAVNGLGAVKVDRSTRWGNPFVVGSRFRASELAPWCVIFSAQQAVEMFRSFCDHQIGTRFRADVVTELRGKNLACWCKDGPCHADVLLEIANAEAGE